MRKLLTYLTQGKEKENYLKSILTLKLNSFP